MIKKAKEKIFKEKGITILALVITIIVLLILAGITIGAITGNNGLIGQTQDAKLETEKAQIKEDLDIMVVQSIGKDGKVDKEVLMPKLETLPDGKEIYDTDEVIYIVYPEYTFKVDLGSGDVTIEDVEVSKDETPWELAGSGTEEEPYLIESIEDLVAFSNSVNEGNRYSSKYVKLTKTLDFKSPLSYDNPKTKVSEKETRIIKEDTNGEEILTFLTKEDGTGFNPIGGNIDIGFYGTFDGNGKEIKNLYINRENEDNVALFSNMTWQSSNPNSTPIGGRIHNLGLTGVIKGGNTVGGISAIGINVYNSYNKANILGKSEVGGIGGQSTTAYNCYNLGNIVLNSEVANGSKYSIGGIIANMQSATAENCYNAGTLEVLNKGYMIGGIFGYGNKVFNCYNLGELKIDQMTGKISALGGIGGSNSYYGNTKNNYNISIINTSKAYESGGIIGSSGYNVQECYYLKGTAEGRN